MAFSATFSVPFAHHLNYFYTYTNTHTHAHVDKVEHVDNLGQGIGHTFRKLSKIWADFKR